MYGSFARRMASTALAVRGLEAVRFRCVVCAGFKPPCAVWSNARKRRVPAEPRLPVGRVGSGTSGLQLEDSAVTLFEPTRLDLLEPLQRRLVETESKLLRGHVVGNNRHLVDHDSRVSAMYVNGLLVVEALL